MKTPASERLRLRACVRGAVQGVGFRPFVFRLASELGLAGWVSNNPQGLFVELEGGRRQLENFLVRVEAERPPRSFIQSLEASWLDGVGYEGFEIRESGLEGAKTALVLPDIATCPDCVAEIFDSANRRYFYPFTNCTNCGPRFSIIESLPYDRVNTSMKMFPMCPECRAEYDDPRDRRFHAQPNACPVCGPQLDLWRGGVRLELSKNPETRSREALRKAADAIIAGEIVAVKGLGGFHLMVAAHLEAAVRRLRELKHREEKPFALMFPSLDTVRAACEISPLEERLLRSPEAPIVLLRQSQISNLKSQISTAVAPGNPNLGVMLPYTPLHHLLMSLVGFPIVATSGNLSDEPICIDGQEALSRLGGIADLFLVHNRPIMRHVDDSIVRVMMNRELVLRRARGFAPLPVPSGSHTAGAHRASRNGKLPEHPAAAATLAVGAHLKNAIGLSVGSNVFLSQHIGDLETDQAFDAFRRVIADFQKLYDVCARVIAADAHPDYLSTKHARELAAATNDQSGAAGSQLVVVQHHMAHVFACMAENEIEPPALGISWDGTGYGLDGTIWGGECFRITDTDCRRVAHLRQFRLPGGDAAIHEPRRTALGVLYELLGDESIAAQHLPPLQTVSDREISAWRRMLQRGLNSPVTSSAGRLFDAIAAIVGLRQQVRFEGQAAMELEFAIGSTETNEAYPFQIEARGGPDSPLMLDWGPIVRGVIEDVETRVDRAKISAKFHNALVEMLVGVAKRIGEERVALSGGCFQNRYLTERAVRRLREEGFRPYWHQRVPPNDGGIALGQIVAAARMAKQN